MYWNANTDSFHFKINPDDNKLATPTTKRNILSNIARIFDPLSLEGPIVIRAKLMLQVLWQASVKWGGPVPEEIRRKWYEYKTKLLRLNE